ncbi:MAG: OmpH family outer membrane protein [Fusobacteriota bacterium]
MRKRLILVMSLIASLTIMANGVGYVDTQKVLQNCKETESTQKFLETKKAELQEELDSEKTKLEEKQNELSQKDRDLTDSEKQELQEMQEKFQVKYQQMQQNLNVLQETMYEKLRSGIDTAIKEVAKQEKYDTVFDKSVIYYGGDDLTKEVIDFLTGSEKIELE